MVGRRIAPPSLPTVIRPGASDRTEHVAPKNPGADVVEATGHKLVILARGATFVARHLLKRSGCNYPIVEGFAADAERVLETLVRSGAITVNGD
jgi:hypothetical protein